MTKKAPTDAEREPAKRPPSVVRLPGFVSDKDIGLGDVVSRAASALGIRPCGGCARRAAALNRLLVLSGRRAR
jgi:hypothetical protein